MTTLRRIALLFAAASLAAACGSDDDGSSNVDNDRDSGRDTLADVGISDAGGGGADAGGGSDSGTMDDAGGGSDAGGGGTDTGGNPLPEPSAPRAYSGGACPPLGSGTVTINSGGTDRSVDIYLPENTTNAGLVFLWHGTGDTPSNFGRAIGASSITDIYDVIAVVPAATGASLFEWAVGPGDDPAPDTALFDDLIACLDEQYDIDNRRVYSTGFSAGALWTSYLLMNRADYLASVITFSGGTGGLTNVAYNTPAYPTPTLAVHGGSGDTFAIVNFMDLTLEMIAGLRNDGHFVVSCDHGGGHTIPFDPFTFAFPFMFDHVYGDGSSPFEAGLGAEWPAYCMIEP